METTTFDNQFNEAMNGPERPQFLSVLCILTWIMCALTFIMTVSGALVKPSPEKQMEQIEEMRKISPEAADQMELALENQSAGSQVMNTLVVLITLGLSAFGASLMWKLKRKGLYVYIAGELLWYASLAFGGMEALAAAGTVSGMGSAVVGMIVGMLLFFDAVFIAMYAANAKYMIVK